MNLNDLSPAPGSTKKRKRVGRGPGSGHGKTATRGHKGRGSRSGGNTPPGYEGGQMPLQRRVPKRGFRNPFRVEFQLVNVGLLGQHFEAGMTVDRDSLVARALVSLRGGPVKLLSDGELSFPLNVRLNRVSTPAKVKIESLGGTVEEVPLV